MEFGSGFVLALLIGAVLFMDRFGDEEEWSLRVYQVALGLTLAFSVISGTSAFILEGSDSLSPFDDSSDSGASRLVFAAAIQSGGGVLSVLFGLGGMQKWRAAPIGIVLGGVFLLIASKGTFTSLSLFVLDASTAARFILFVTSFGGFIALYWYGLGRWDEYVEGAELADESEDGAAD